MNALYSILKAITIPFVFVFTLLVFSVLFSEQSFAVIELMEDNELANVDGQLSEVRLVNHKVENDTVRIFLDIHQEVYGTIDSARLGYYYKDSAALASTPMEIGLSGFVGFYHAADSVNNGANFSFMKVTSDFNTMAPQNGASLEPWGQGAHNSDDIEGSVTKNINNFDWDLWIDNLQLGESPDRPQMVNGLIMRFEFDDNLVNNPNAHLERIVIGTNDLQGNMYLNAQRLTAVMNPLLLTNSTNRSAGAVDPYKYTAGAMMIQRDPMIQSMGVAVHNVEDRDTGAWLVIDLEGDHLSYVFVAGFPENGTTFNFTEANGNTGYQGMDLWNPSWAPGDGTASINSGMAGNDPYGTARQETYDGGNEH